MLSLVDCNRDKVVKWTYDVWGKVLPTTGTMASSLGALNPFRYRGYVYDTETGLYYLRSRYYHPTWQRFVNADSYLGFRGELFAHNVYTYCINSPVCLVDNNGRVGTMGAYEPYYGFYHAEVQKWIVAHNVGVAMEMPTSTGRIDPYNVRSTEIYEVKLNQPEHIEAGKTQLERYMRGNLPTRLGDARQLVLPPDSTLRYEYENAIVDISVQAEGSLVLYSAKQTRKRKPQPIPVTVEVPEREKACNEQFSRQRVWAKALGLTILVFGLINPLPGDETIGLGLLLAP